MSKIQKTLQTVSSLLNYRRIKKQLKNIDSNTFFVFQTYQIGGGERVHAEIMSLFAHLNPTCFITLIPLNKGFEKEFRKSAKIIELQRWGSKKAFMPIMAKKVATEINKQREPIVFGCNTNFFYDLIPHLKPHVKIMGLTHAFTENCNGVELYSLPFVDRIDKRVVLGNKTLDDYRKLYEKNNIPRKYLDRFKIIPNQVNSPDTYTRKDYTLPLNIIFVARNSPEKRPEVFFHIVEECLRQQIPVKFTVVGGFEEYKNKFQKHVTFTGEISDKDKLNSIYKEAHLILVTSIVEGFPMVLLEGMAYGVVPISTSVGEIPFFISEAYNNGFLIDNTLSTENIVLSFVEIIKKCTLDTKMLERYSKTGFELVKNDFNHSKFKEAYEEVFRS